MTLTIRRERKEEYRAVEELTREAFWNLYVPGCSEHLILHNLRNSPDFVPELDCVAEKAGRIVGHIVYSRGAIKGQQGKETEVLCFGPISVWPALQKQGVGSALIIHTINLARTTDYPAICIYGDPRYYARFGFRCGEKYDIQTADGKFAVALLVLELRPDALRDSTGRFIESPAFETDPSKVEVFDSTFPPKAKAETDSQREFRFLVSLRY